MKNHKEGETIMEDKISCYVGSYIKTKEETYFTYVTFNKTHTHNLNGKVFDKDCVAVIKARSHNEAVDIALDFFGNQFDSAVYWDKFDLGCMNKYPRGIIKLNYQGEDYETLNQWLSKRDPCLLIKENSSKDDRTSNTALPGVYSKRPY